MLYGVESIFANDDFMHSNWRDLDQSFTIDRYRNDFPSPGYMEHVFPALKLLHLPRFYDIRRTSCDHPHTGVTVLQWSTEGWSGIPCALGTFPNLRSLTIVLTMPRACSVEWPGPVDDTRRIVDRLDHIRIVNFDPSTQDSGGYYIQDVGVFDMLSSGGKKTMIIEYFEHYDWPRQAAKIFRARSTPIKASVALEAGDIWSRLRLVFCEEDILGRVCTVTMPVELHHVLKMSNPLLQLSTNTLHTLTIPLYRVPDLFGLALDILVQLHLVVPLPALRIDLARIVDSWRGDDRVVAPMLQELQIRSSSLMSMSKNRNREVTIRAKILEEVLERLPKSPVLRLLGVCVVSD